MPLDVALDYAVQIANALDAAHRQGVIHGDLEPENILITEFGVRLQGLAVPQGRHSAVGLLQVVQGVSGCGQERAEQGYEAGCHDSRSQTPEGRKRRAQSR